MPKRKVASILWTERSLQNAILIKEYLISNFSDKEVDRFYAVLQSFEIAVCAFPELYPQSSVKRDIRRAVLSRVFSAYYRVNNGKIEVIALVDNRCDTSQWL
jgi:plasmid stabilization system protein ParE